MQDRYKVTTWHGEGNTLFYVMDTVENDCVLTFQTIEGDTLRNAREFCDYMNSRKAGAR